MCTFRYNPVLLKKEGDTFFVEIDMFFVCDDVGENESLMFTPILMDEHHHLELPLVLVAGKSRYWAFKRALWGLGANVLRSYRIKKIFKGINQNSISYLYRIHLKHEAWMEYGTIKFV